MNSRIVAPAATLWVIEPDLAVQKIYAAEFDAFDVQAFSSFGDFWERYSKRDRAAPSGLVVAELQLPDGDLLSACGFGAGLERVPARDVIVVSLRQDLDSIRRCMKAGILDYFAKPLCISEVVAKVERHLEAKHGIARRLDSSILINANALTIRRGASPPVALTPKQFQLVSILANSVERAVPCIELRRQIWGSTRISAKTIGVHMTHLRSRLRAVGLRILHVEPSSYRIEILPVSSPEVGGPH